MNLFFKCFSIVGVFSLASVVLINYVVDPYGSHEKRIKGFNERKLPHLYSAAYISDIYKRYAKGDAVRYSFIGTSHIDIGIDEQKNYFLEKIAIRGMDISESAWVLRKILTEAKVPKTVFVEVCVNGDQDRPIQQEEFKKLFSLRNVLLSIKTVLHNHSPDRFTFVSKEKVKVKKVEVKSLSALISEKSVLRTLTNLEIDAFNAIHTESYKIKNDLAHEIVFFIPPLPHETMELNNNKEIYGPIINQLEAIFNVPVSRKNNLKFSFVNLLDKKIGEKYQFENNNFNEGWYDGTHFNPIIGDEVINYLIDYTE